MRTEPARKLFTQEQVERAKKTILAKYINPEGYTRTWKNSNLVKYKINFVDKTSVFVIMTSRQRDYFFKNKFSLFVIDAGGEGYQVKIN